MAEDLGLVRKTYWLDIFTESNDEKYERDYRIYFRKTKTQWKVGSVLTERSFDDSIAGTAEDGFCEASGICTVVQTKGPATGLEAILRIRMQSVALLFSLVLVSSSRS